MERRKDSKGRVLEKGENERADGTYMYRYTDSYGTRRTIYGKDLSTLREAERRIGRDIDDGINTSLADETLNQQFERFCKLSACRAASTVTRYRMFWNAYMKDSPLGNKRLRNIKRSDGVLFINDLTQKGLAANTIIGYFYIVKCCLDSAVYDDIIRYNPFGKVRLPEKDVQERVALTDEQREYFLSFIKHSKVYARYYPMFMFMFETGVRIGELCGMTWENVDLRNKTVTIDHQVVYGRVNGEGCRFYACTTKTHKGIRTIPLTWAATEALSQQRLNQLKAGQFSTVEVDGYKDFVFVTSKGNPCTKSGVDAVLKNIVGRINALDPEIDFPMISAHNLRHTCCTRMVEAKMDVKAVQKILGHKDVSTTLNVYTHISESKVASEIEKLEDMAQ